MKEKLRHLELFAGIGGFRKAIDLFCKDNDMISECVGFSEKDKFAVQTYKANFDTKGEIEIGDILDFTSDIENIKNLPDFDLLTGGFPCQAFSMMGKKKGFDDHRGEVFYSITDILIVKQPKYILLENVRNLKTHNKGKTFKEIKRSLEDDAGYIIDADILNTADFGLPQTRRRIFIFGIRKDLVDKNSDVVFDVGKVLEFSRNLNGETSLYKYKTVLDGVLEKKVDPKYYLSDRVKPTILANGSKNFWSKSEINQLIARPLTATMVKLHRACQDNYYSDDFLKSRNKKKYLELSFTKEEEAKHAIRKLTPVEAFRLQGFDKRFVTNAIKAGVSNHQLYRQAGNAVSVNTVYYALYKIFNYTLNNI